VGRSILAERVVKLTEIRKQNWPYLTVCVVYYAWVLAATIVLPILIRGGGAHQLFSPEALAFTIVLLLLTSAVGIAVTRPQWFVKFVRLGAALLVLVFFGTLFAPPGVQVYLAPLLGVSMGLVNIGVLTPFFYILNNSEKFFALLLVNVCIGLFVLLFHVIAQSYVAVVVALTAILLISLAPTCFFRLHSLETPPDKPPVVEHLDEKFEQYGFSKRETQVCLLLLEGYTMRQAGAILQITYATVNSHCTALYRKASVNSKIQLLKLFTS
jgi:DNA-binding CsgD family transcriptional regulator